MRQIQFSITCLALLLSFQSCKPKDKHQAMQDLLRRDSAKQAIKEEKKVSQVREIILQKWRVVETLPAPESEEDRQTLLSTLIEFTADGRVMVTTGGETKQEGSYTLSMDNRYMLSTDIGRSEVDSIFIAEIDPGKLVLIGEKDKRKIILQPFK